jgi:predicted dehydrogenase
MHRLRVAIAGYGAVAEIHARCLKERSDVELVAIVGPRREPALEFASRHGVTQKFAALPDAFETIHPDAVIITSPTDLHPLHAEQAIAAGIHALVEFPFVAASDRLNTVFQQAREKRLLLAVAHTSRFIWSFSQARTLIGSGKLGHVRTVHYIRFVNRPAGTGAGGRPRTWHDDVLLHHAGHALDVLLFWFGAEVRLVNAVAPRTPEGRRNVGLLLNGPAACPITATLSYDAPVPLMQVDVVAEKGAVRIDGFARLYVNQQEHTPDRPADDDAAYYASIRDQDHRFIDALRGRAGFPVAAEETLALNDMLAQAEGLCSRTNRGESNP